MTANVFARITKVDEERRLIYGRATEEIVDRSGEIFDYTSSKPLFEKWSSDCHKDSQGKSLGNLRSMHKPIAAGRLDDIIFNDVEKAIDVTAKVVDDDEWNKVLEGVYTGFSIGGDYTRKWKDTIDGKQVTRFTANPAELSLVDRPCVPTAKFFDVLKADGSTLQKMFKEFASPSDSTSGIAPYSAKTSRYADVKNKKYPIDTAERVRSAWDYIGKPKNASKYSAADLHAIKANIAAAWQAKIDKCGPPNAEKSAVTTIKKGVDSVSSLADIVQRLKWLADGSNYERQFEGDDSDIAERLMAHARDLLYTLADMAKEEGDELTMGGNLVDGSIKADAIGGLKKACEALAKNPLCNNDDDQALFTSTAAVIESLEKRLSAPSQSQAEEITMSTATAQQQDAANKLAKAAPADSGDDETAEERQARLDARKTKKDAEAAKALGLPANGTELKKMLQDSADSAAVNALTLFAKALGVNIDAGASGLAKREDSEDEKIAKAIERGIAAGLAAGNRGQSRQPTLMVVGKDGKTEKVSSGDLAKTVNPVVGARDEQQGEVATLIKAIHAKGPDFYENDPQRVTK